MRTAAVILAVARREVHKIFRDTWTAVAMFVVPAIVGPVLVFMYAAGTVREIPTLVVDRDCSEMSRSLIRALDAHEAIDVHCVSTEGRDIEELMRSGEISCAVSIPESFERNLKRGERVEVVCFLNGTNMVLSNYALKAVTTTVATASAVASMEKMKRVGIPASAVMSAYSPLAVSPRYLFNPAQSYSAFFMPGILAALLQQVAVIGAALTWVREFRSGEIGELAAMTPSVALQTAGKLLVYVGVTLLWAVFLFVGLFTAAGVPYTGSVAAGFVAILLMVIGMVLVAMLMSSLFAHRETAIQIVFIVSSPAFLVSGYTFPQMAMTGFARAIGYVVPLTPFLTAWRRLVLYEATSADVQGQILLLLLYSIVLAIPVLFIVRKRERATLERSSRHDE